ncbi:MAG: acylphosphatase [Ignavibacteriaceae bacterium]|nr:acylphosphatase [Ignavibacteriaceae bacterium]
MNERRAEILVDGLVQGVGFRYFVVRQAEKLNLNGFVKNLPSGEVLAVVEGAEGMIAELYKQMKSGPMRSSVRRHKIEWGEMKNEFKGFSVKY